MPVIEEYRDPRDRVLYSPIATRPKIKWPDGARVAFWVSPNVEFYEYIPPTSKNSSVFARVPAPDVQQYSYTDYGNRVGFWRVTEILDDLNLRATVSLNAAVLDHHPEIATAMIERNWAFMSHGIYNTRPLYGLDAAEQRAFLQTANECLVRHTGKPFRGMLGPQLSMTLETPDLMAEEGLVYHTDWIHDDQPVPIKVRNGRMISVPYSYELNDVPMGASPELFQKLCTDGFDRLWREGADSGRVMCIALHPYLVGQPHFAKALRNTLAYICGHDDVWLTTADEIADHYLTHCYDEQVAHAEGLTQVYGAAR